RRGRGSRAGLPRPSHRGPRAHPPHRGDDNRDETRGDDGVRFPPVSYRNLVLAQEGRLAVLTVSRPEKRNALDTETVAELHRALEDVRRAGAGVLVITGAGEKAFVSGADIAALRARGRDDALASINSALMTAIENHDAVTIAAVNGVALGGGCELALACDL